MRTATILSAISLLLGLGAGPICSAPAARPAPDDLPRAEAHGQLQQVFAFAQAMPTGVAVSEDGRIFVSFPRWGDDVPYTVAELRDGQVHPYPDAATNRASDSDPASHFISVQSVVADRHGRLWVLDTAAPGFSAPRPGGAKLVAIDLAGDRVAKTIVLGPDVMTPATYLNDVRFEFGAGREGVAYLTDSSIGSGSGIIVVDLASGHAQRRLAGHHSVLPDPDFLPQIEGETLMQRPASGEPSAWQVAADGIALSPDGLTLYYSPLSSRHLFSVPTRLLRDPGASETALADAVADLGEKGASDGLEADAQGAIYAGDYEHNSIRRRSPDGRWQTLAQDPRILWPDSLAIGPDGYLYFTANQLHRQAAFHGGHDQRRKPYSLMRIRIDAAPVP